MENWRDELPDELKTSTNLAKYDTLEDALRGGDEAASRLGRSITIPSEDAGEDARAEFITKLQAQAPNLTLHPDHADDHGDEFWGLLGRPEEAKDYAPAEGFEGLPEDYIESLRGVAKEAGWTKKQFQATLTAFATEHAEQAQAVTEAQDADQAVVTGKWGNAEDGKKGAIAALVSKFEDPDHKLGDLNAAAYLMLDNIVKAFTGNGPQSFKAPADAGGMTPSEINDELSQIDDRLIKEGMKMPRPTHKALMAKKTKLLQMRAA